MILFLFLLVLMLSFSSLNLPAKAQANSIRQIERASEDARMFDQMTRVSQWVDSYCVLNRRFPEEGEEMKASVQQINLLIPNSPYNPQSIKLMSGLDYDPLNAASDYPDNGATPNRVRLVLDLSLTELEVENWRTDPPVDWQEAPGTITAISNQTNIFVVWGAGADGLPLRDQYNKQVLLLIGRCRMLYDAQE